MTLHRHQLMKTSSNNGHLSCAAPIQQRRKNIGRKQPRFDVRIYSCASTCDFSHQSDFHQMIFEGVVSHLTPYQDFMSSISYKRLLFNLVVNLSASRRESQGQQLVDFASSKNLIASYIEFFTNGHEFWPSISVATLNKIWLN